MQIWGSLSKETQVAQPCNQLRDFIPATALHIQENVYYVSQSLKNCPSSRCAIAATSVCSDTDGFRKQIDHTSTDFILLIVYYYNMS